MPMIPAAVAAMLACARIGAVHSVVFGGFSPESIKSRILDSDCRVVITADQGLRGGKPIPLKANVDQALEGCPDVHTVLVYRHTGADIAWQDGRDGWYQDLLASASADCPAEPMDAEDPLFILYTSGSTGKPKGVLHTTGGYLTYVALTHKYVFDYHDGDVYWCTADVGWVTGHSYIVYGPLANGATIAGVRGRAHAPHAGALLGSHRQAPGQHLLHRADRHPRPDARRRRPGAGHQPQIPAPARFGRRADQPGGLGVVPPRGGRGALPDRRHLVADRDRRHPDLAAAGRDGAQARLGHQAAVWHRAGADGRQRQRAAPAPPAATWS